MVHSLASQRNQRQVGYCHQVGQFLNGRYPDFHNSCPHSVFDSDGEFLLIEAAETLPPWVKPTNSENRVRPPSASLVRAFLIYAIKSPIGLDLQLPPTSDSYLTRISTL